MNDYLVYIFLILYTLLFLHYIWSCIIQYNPAELGCKINKMIMFVCNVCANYISCNSRMSIWRRWWNAMGRLTGLWLRAIFLVGWTFTASIAGRNFLIRSSSRDHGQRRSNMALSCFETTISCLSYFCWKHFVVY